MTSTLRMRPSRTTIGICLTWFFLAGTVQAGDLPQFKEHVITDSIKFGYQLVAADLTGDGKKDLIAIDERATDLAWFESPNWTRHVLAAFRCGNLRGRRESTRGVLPGPRRRM